MKVTEEVYQVGGGALTAPEDAAVYLVSVEGHAALVDAGCGWEQERLLENVAKRGVKPEQIELLLITHCHFDHTGGAKGLRDALGCTVVAHALDAPYLEQGDSGVTAAAWYGAKIAPCPVDRKLSGAREQIELGGRRIEAIHTPGHSPGSVVYLVESEGLRVLFAQDVHGPLDPSLLSNRRDYRRSLELLLSLEADILCEGHYGVYRGREKAARFIRDFLGG